MSNTDNVVPLHSEDQIMDDAGIWLVRLDEGLSDAQKQELTSWLRHRRHRDAFLEMAQLWDKMDCLSQLSELFPDVPNKTRRHTPLLAMAATVMLMVFTGLTTWQLWPVSPSVLQVQHVGTFTSAVGQQRQIPLPDGSHLWLNTDSVADVTFTGNQRLIHLRRGELHIAVAKDRQRPLSVLAGQQQIQAVGTEFNVALNQDDVELIVTEGKVKVASGVSGKQDLLGKDKVTLADNSLAVTQGFKARLNTQQTGTLQRMRSDELESVQAWRNGQLIFRGEPLAAVLHEVSRYTTKQFVIRDTQLAQVQVAGLFNTRDVDAMLASLAQNFGLQFTEKSPNQVEVTAG